MPLRSATRVANHASSGVWEDLHAGPKVVLYDAVDTLGAGRTWITMGSVFAISKLMDYEGTEDSTADYFDTHAVLTGGQSSFLSRLGTGAVLLGLGTAWYGVAQAREDARGLSESKLMLRSLATTGISTLLLKAAFPDERPNGANGGYPSGHTSMSFAAATSLWQGYGVRVGLPAVTLATLVALQRLDSRAHDMDDIFGGVALGWVVATSIHRREAPKVLGAEVSIAFHEGLAGPGLALTWSF